MSTIVIEEMFEVAGPYCPVPTTPRERALHTVNWFLTGDQTLSHYSLGLKVQDLQKLNHEK
jgi:hypothetical protein